MRGQRERELKRSAGAARYLAEKARIAIGRLDLDFDALVRLLVSTDWLLAADSR